MFGRFAADVLDANVSVNMFTVPDACYGAIVNINLVNPHETNDAVIELAYSMNAVGPDNEDYIEKGAVIPAMGGVLERQKQFLSPGECVFVKSNIAGVTVRIEGKLITEARDQ